MSPKVGVELACRGMRANSGAAVGIVGNRHAALAAGSAKPSPANMKA